MQAVLLRLFGSFALTDSWLLDHFTEKREDHDDVEEP